MDRLNKILDGMRIEVGDERKLEVYRSLSTGSYPRGSFFLLVALLYALNAAYLSSLSGLLASSGKIFLHVHLGTSTVAVGLVGFFVLLLCWGVKQLDWLNRLLMLGLVMVFVLLCWKMIPHGQIAHLAS